jgi:hypothetical protein
MKRLPKGSRTEAEGRVGLWGHPEALLAPPSQKATIPTKEEMYIYFRRLPDFLMLPTNCIE